MEDHDADRNSTPFSWVTEEALEFDAEGDDEQYGHSYEVEGSEVAEEQEEDEEDDDDDDDNRSHSSKSSSATASTSASARLRRNFTDILRDSTPLASLFSTPRETIPDVTNAAKQGGLHTALMRNPRRGQVRVHNGQLRRENTFWVVMGRDPDAVEHLLELDEQDYETRAMVGAYPLDPRLIQTTFLDVLIAGAIGGFAVFWALSSLR